MPLSPTLLLVDDDSIIAESLQYVLSEDYDVTIAPDRKTCIAMLEKMPNPPQLALVDLGLPPDIHKPDEGFAVIRHIRQFFPSTRILVLSGQDSKRYIEDAKELGVLDFVPKPCDIAELKARLKKQLDIGSEVVDETQEKMGIIGKSAAIELLRMQIRQLSISPYPILIQGDSGSGKELTALNLHRFSARAEHPFLTLNCAAFNGELLESQLFGHAKGAFTGATETKSGFFEEAAEGTLFLDEIADMPIDLQAKLLRVLENGEYYRLGETRSRISTARVLAASNRDLMDAIGQGQFREDLYHRLSVLTIRVPSMRDRDVDKAVLLDFFQQQVGSQMGGFVLDDDAKKLWNDYDFPGNVRELRNIVIRLSAKYPGQTIKPSILLQEMSTSVSRASDVGESEIFRKNLQTEGFQLNDELKRIEKEYIDLALEQSADNMSKAANMLGVNRSTLYSRLDR